MPPTIPAPPAGTLVLATAKAATATTRAGRLSWSPALSGAACAVAGAVGVEQAGWMGAGLVAAVVAVWCGVVMPLARQRSRTGDVGAHDADGLRLPRLVVPVWRRNISAAREHAADSAQSLVESFADVVGHLDEALAEPDAQALLQPGAAETLLARQQPELERLLATTRQLVAMKDEMLGGLMATNNTLVDMAGLIQEVQRISRATHLLALNASVEATRAGAHGQGFGVVAQEVRQLATQSREAGNRLREHVGAMQTRLQGIQRSVRRHDTDEDEIVLQAQENARAVVRSLLSSTASLVQASRAMREGGRRVHDDLERILMELQSHDRLAQMLAAVTDDMARMGDWLDGRPDELAAAPAQWLERLERSYTMEEQRSTHHALAVVDKPTGVEFF